MLVLLGLLMFIYMFGVSIYVLNGLEPLPAFDSLFQAALLCGVGWWLKADAKKSAVQSVYCLGLVLSLWFIILPYHLFKTRGASGLIPLLALFGCFTVAPIVAMILYLLLLTFNPP